MPDEPTRPDHDPRPGPGHPGTDQAPAGQPTTDQSATAQDATVRGAGGGPSGWPTAASAPADGWPGGGRAGGSPGGEADDWPEDDWPEDDHEAGLPWPPPSGGSGDRPRRRRPLMLAVIAVAALVTGAGVTLAVSSELSPSSPAAASRGQSPVATGPGGSDGSGQLPGGALPGGALPGGTGTAQMFIAGRVQAISPTSITLGAPGRAVTAAITRATRVSGGATSVSQIKVGDNASAQITMRHGKPVVTSIQDPARPPSGP